MKLLPDHLNVKFISLVLLLLCNLISISHMYGYVNLLAGADDRESDDRLALIAFRNEITEDPLGSLSSWNSNNNSHHFCKWRGVTCSLLHRNRVTGLDLNSRGLVGSISPYIGNLSFLKVLFLYNNSLSGEVPQQIGRLFRLERLGLSHNFLEGEIPADISGCSNLRNLNISHNKLVGSIPNELSSFHNLVQLEFSNNNLAGEIPTSFGNLSSTLTILDFSYNNLEGSIPSTVSQLTALKILRLDSNRFSGTVPSSIYNISSLQIISLMDYQLHGSIPFNIGSTLSNLTDFAISKNNFTGTIPSSFSNMSRLENLLLAINNFVGSVPYNLGDIRSLRFLVLAANKLGKGQTNDLRFIDSLVNCTNLKLLLAGDNNLGGVLPNSVANLTTNLDRLVLENNKIHGSVPIGIQNIVGLIDLGLGNNLLTGSIPPGIGNLQNLGILRLHTNKLSGPIPSSFGKLTQLIQLFLYDNHLTGSIPSSLGNCKSLQSLNLHSNRLSGSIPKQVFQLPSLSVLFSLAKNSFTGLLPAEVGNLKNLGVFELADNKLSGDIPSTIGQCLSLRSLNLQGNFFQGNIPPAIGFLKGLETLNLSHNNLSGIIPKGLEILTTLNLLDLSYNNLKGEMPKDGVFKNISPLSIEGNNMLCGGMPEMKLQNCSMPLRKTKAIKVIVIIIVAVLSLTLTVFSASLYWRKKSITKLPSTSLDVGIWFKGISYNELLKSTNGFNKSTNLLGVGSFSSVYKGILHQDESKPVAVKVLHLQQRGATKSFLVECDALRKVRHRNLLKIITCCSSTDFQGNPFKALVFEFMNNGSLENWLHPAVSDTNNDDHIQENNLNLERRLSIAVDVASALNYLHHDSQSPIVHCDVKPSNVLLDDDLTAHVGDFGLAKFLFNPSSNSPQLNELDASSVAIKGSIGYVSPEYGMGCGYQNTARVNLGKSEDPRERSE